MSPARRPSATDWRLVAEIFGPSQYEARLDRTLEVVAERVSLPLVYLYLLDASGRRLRLERSRGRAAAPAGAGPLISSESDQSGAEWSAPTAALELPRSQEDESDRTVQTPVGEMQAIALHDPAGSLVAVIQVGPLRPGRRGRAAANQLRSAREPIAFALGRAIEAERLRQRAQEATARLEAQERLAGSALDLDRFTGLLLDMALSSTRTEAGFVAIGDQEGRLEIRASSGMPERFEDALDLAPAGGTFDWSPAEYGGALILEDVAAATRLGIRSLLAVPLMEEQQPLGIFALVNFGEGGSFDDPNALELCAVFADQIRLMLHNQRVFHDFAERYLDTLKALAVSLDARANQTQAHHVRVASAASALGATLGITGKRLQALRMAALIHDVGLAAVSEGEGAEADIEHPTVGAGLIEHLPVHPDLVAAVATHHEWLDGWGFPRGLSGEQIPLAGRVLAMAEFLIEMNTDTPVRPAWSARRLVEELRERRGTQFDPEVADAAIRLLESTGSQVLLGHRR